MAESQSIEIVSNVPFSTQDLFSKLNVIDESGSDFAFNVFALEKNWSKYQTLYVLDNQKIAGYAVCQVLFGEVEILNICIAKAYQSKGFGGQLLSHLLLKLSEKNERVFLEVRESNQNAIKLYKKLGFEQIGIRKNYYANKSNTSKENGLVLQKTL